MKVISKVCGLLALSLIVACSDSGSSNRSNPEPVVNPSQLRVTHASPDAPAVNVYVDGELALEEVEFKQSSGLIVFDEPTTISVEVKGILPDESEVSVIGPVDISLEEGLRTDVIAFDNLFDNTGAVGIQAKLLDPVEIEEGITDVRVSVMHAAPSVGDVDIYVSAPGDALSNVMPIDAGFGDAAGPVSLEADTDYQIRITPDGDNTVVYDSGVVNFSAGTELVVVAVENTFKVGTSPVNLLAVGPDGASEVLDVNIGASVRVVHNSADTPAVDVLIDGNLALDAVPFPAASNYEDIEAPAGTYNVVVAADADNSIAPIDENLMLEATKSYTGIAVGSFADSSIELVVTEDDRRNVATAAIVQIIHGSYIVAAEIPVDIYLTTDGVIADADPAVQSLAYKESTGQLPLSPGDYWVTVTAAGDKSVVAFDSGGALNLAGGTNYTIIARDPSPDEVVGTPLINVTILAD
jgi:Domain of unknown function (DUF4397)